MEGNYRLRNNSASCELWEFIVGKTVKSVEFREFHSDRDVRIYFTDGTLIDLQATYDDSGVEIARIGIPQ